MEERESVLGFRPQKERIYNKLLPYAELIDDESTKAFGEIKGYLAKAVGLRDIKVGAAHWCGQLSRYIRLYGMKFSKEDHIALIKLLFELTTIPELEVSLVQKFACQLVGLLKKKELLTREDLVLPWKPLYELAEWVIYSRYEHLGLQFFPPNIDNVLKNLVKHCREYFPESATEEMLNEWRPLLCPFDVTNIKAVHYLEHFLPTNLPATKQHLGYMLWFDEMINLWDSYHNTPTWESGMVNLFSRLAHDNIGYIDWSPYVSKIFNRFLRSFNLPVGTQKVQVGRSNNTYDIESTVIWIVSMMGGPNNQLVQDHIDKLFKALQNFFHPSNYGTWNLKLSGLLMAFPKNFVKRLHRERYKKPSWDTHIPDNTKLTDQNVTDFVKSIAPVVSVAMFSKFGSHDSAIALRYLSNMRPEIVVPDLLEKMYPAMENLTEPHRLIACMICVVSVARPMLTAGRWYPEGRSHILPLLNLSLPGIDHNDFKKSVVTFQMISMFITLIPIVDCSEAVHLREDLSETERELCSATAQFEDFVLQFLDRVFLLIENSAQEHSHVETTRLNSEQTMVEMALTSTFTSVLQQCSAPIYQSALRRLFNFVSNSVYEIKVGGRFTSNLCRAAARVNPQAAVKTFLPLFCRNIKEHMDSHEGIEKEEHLDNGFLWNLQMLAQLVRCNGKVLLPYREDLLSVLSLTLHLKCIQGYELAGQLLRFVLRALTLHYPLDYKSIAESFDRPVTEYLAINDWAMPGDIYNLNVEWHIPSSEEISYAHAIINSLLGTELDIIAKIQEAPVEREELLQRLNVILECILGAGAVFPMWNGTAVELAELELESKVPLHRFDCCCKGSDLEVQFQAQNVRESVVGAMGKLLEHLLEKSEDDTKSLCKIIRIFETVLFFFGASKPDFDARWKSFHSVKEAVEDKLREKKKHLRPILVDRVVLQQELRMLHSNSRVFTELHKKILLQLYGLSLSRYGEVRKKAQAVLCSIHTNYAYSYRCILDDLAEKLVNSNTPEKQFKVRKKAQEVLFQSYANLPYSYRCMLDDLEVRLVTPTTPEHVFKGALYVIYGNGRYNLAAKRSWKVIGKLWPAIVQAQHFEKPSILKIVDDIVIKVSKGMESPAIRINTTSGCIAAAKCLLECRVPNPNQSQLVEQDLKEGVQYEEKRNEQAKGLYHQLTSELVSLVKSGNLMWKFSQFGMELLSMLLRYDERLNEEGVELFMRGMVHDSLIIRKLSTGSMAAILKQQKRKHPKVVIDPYKISGTQVSGYDKFRPGNREDNNWILYDSQNLLDTKEKWEKAVFVEKTHWGFYCWPKEMKVYADSSQQPKLDRTLDELPTEEKPIYTCLAHKNFVSKFVELLALEEHKGRDKFREKHSTLLKGIFRNFGDTFLEEFKSKIETLLEDMSPSCESKHRCAMEILAGIIRGSKHWPYEKTKALWDWASVIIADILKKMTPETQKDWGTFFTVISESRDPRKLHWLFELLLKEPVLEGNSSMHDTSRLFAITSAIVQQEWRIPDILDRLLKQTLMKNLSHRYKNVRDRIGILLSSIFLYDYKVSPECCTQSPRRQDFVDVVIRDLDPLKDSVLTENGNSLAGDENKVNGDSKVSENSKGEEKMEVDGENSTDQEKERDEQIKECKTVMKWLSNGMGKMYTSMPSELLQFLPIICALEYETKDEELKSDCCMALACFSQALIQPDTMQAALHAIKEVIGLKSWHARVAVLGYIQVMVFCNFFTFHKPEYKHKIQEFVFHLICDDQLEVREMAAVTLSGLLHCGYLKMNQDMVNHFESLSKNKLRRRKGVTQDPVDLSVLIKRHAGVLGLSAFVQAYPYDVPEFMPQILMDLSNHVNDPQPIQMTVKKTLSNFRRTHHDNWHDHKQMFTDDQLVILTDLLVSPTYYA
ncbi:hypothetical protein FSP39_017345 [Pinctada imbricata]|uniref:Proteasome activator complex subunit 4 n=1 Tax=Pinctada imbricata TaxID=66713 RepID=A0AA89BS68_PINIB|nr:hypothetical protein FSP39_017345 [Pinctada imbricata]